MVTAAGLRRSLSWAGRAWRSLEQRVLPESCAFCGLELSAGDRPVCDACHATLPWVEAACRRCGCPLSAASSVAGVCGHCQACPPPFTTLVAPLRYEFPVDAAIKALKFRRRLHYLPAFAAILAGPAQDLAGDIEAMLPVPLHWRRQLLRGFNQATELCRLLTPVLPVPILQRVQRARSTRYQSGLGASARRSNLRGAFRLRGHVDASHVLIVDDVVTTGATVEQLAATLRAGGVERVSVLAIARAFRPD
jgi:ComF family protein